MNLRSAHRIELLRKGETVAYASSGTSMVPRIFPGQKIVLEPVADTSSLKVGDAVYCKVNGNVFTHKISGIRGKGKNLQFQISNNHGHVNGWTSAKQIFGKCIRVED